MIQYKLGLYEKSMPNGLCWREKLLSAKEAGFDFMEISIDETEEKLARLDMSREERFEIVKTAYGVGLPIASMCLSGHRKFPLGSKNRQLRERSLDIMKKAIEFACDFGIRIIQLAGYDVYYEDSTSITTAYFEENLVKCVKMASAAGVTLAFETMETPFMDTVSKAMDYVHHINSPYLQVYPDIGNLTNASLLYGFDLAEDLEAGRGHIVAMHLKETIKGKYREIPFGTGRVDFASAAIHAIDMGVRRYVGEFWYIGAKDWKRELVFAENFLRNYLDKAIQASSSAQ